VKKWDLTVPMSVLCLKLPSAKTIEWIEDIMCKVKKTIDLSAMWVDAPELMIQDEGDKLAK